MKKFLTFFLFSIYTTTAIAADHSLSYKIDAPIYVGTSKYETLQFDVTIGISYMSITGGILDAERYNAPFTGSCFLNSLNGFYCSINIDHNSGTLVLEPDLSGTLWIKGFTGATIGTSPVTLIEAK